MTAINPYPKVIVPTRNRPKKVAAFLAYLSHFYPGTQVVMADGSDPDQQAQVGQICADAQGPIDVAFHPYPAALSYFERLLDITSATPDDVMVMCADDDYPIMDTARMAADQLRQREQITFVMPFNVVLTKTETGAMTGRLGIAHNVLGQTPSARLTAFSKWRYATSYGVSRRDALIARYRGLSKVYCAGFVDFQIGAEDSLSGKILALPQLGAIRTQDLSGSYMRPSDKLIFLRRSETVLTIIDTLTERLTTLEDISPDAARAVVNRAIGYQIAHLTGASSASRAGFTKTLPFLQPVVQDQFAAFYDLFQNGTAMRQQFQEQLLHIGRIIVSDIATDATEHGGNYETF